MGCVPSSSRSNNKSQPTPDDGGAGPGIDSMRRPKYMTADPDLGWRSISEGLIGSYPCMGFLVDFQNERSGNVLKRLDLICLALNVAERASSLANRYGVKDVAAFQSSSNLLEDLAKQHSHQGKDAVEEAHSWQVELSKDMKKILKHFGCPDFGWKLEARCCPTAPLIKKCPQLFITGDQCTSRQTLDESDVDNGKAMMLQELASIPEYLQKFEGASSERVLLDISEVAEQLFRLEKAENTGHRIPNCSFGWNVIEDTSHCVAAVGIQPRETFAVPVSSPDGEGLLLVPEELILQIASWVQQTYLTAPAFC